MRIELLVSGEWVWFHVLKWPGTPHYEYRVLALGEDEFGRWFGRSGPTPIYRDGKLLFDEEWRVVTLIPPGEPRWKSSWFADHPEIDIYVDVICGLDQKGAEIALFDMDLDVVRRPDGRVDIVDLDEFEENQVVLEYRPIMIEEAIQTAHQLKSTIEQGEEPFGSAARRWFEVLAEGIEPSL